MARKKMCPYCAVDVYVDDHNHKDIVYKRIGSLLGEDIYLQIGIYSEVGFDDLRLMTDVGPCIKNSNKLVITKINYCPMCGRKL